jgi:hypothetical protein
VPKQGQHGHRHFLLSTRHATALRACHDFMGVCSVTLSSDIGGYYSPANSNGVAGIRRRHTLTRIGSLVTLLSHVTKSQVRPASRCAANTCRLQSTAYQIELTAQVQVAPEREKFSACAPTAGHLLEAIQLNAQHWPCAGRRGRGKVRIACAI